ncbi:MAG: DUF2891 domain-containing protein [Acidobacteriota bacterium]|nr:DUF2891 domain-containing protein [Acidobacteriota bacterium]
MAASLFGGEAVKTVGEKEAARFAELALACVHQEYPNKISHVMNSDADVAAPRVLHPAFYGCFDWHSSVHGHWLLVRLLRLFPEAGFADRIERALNQSFTAANMEGEVAYFHAKGRAAYERPYGLAWLLQLAAELREWKDPRAERWLTVLEPLEAVVAERFRQWLPKLAYPIRTGEHSQTSFAFGLALDWARTRDDRQLTTLLEEKIRTFHMKDRGCNLAFEPSGQDFVSPCLAEADLMRRVLKPGKFASWLTAFLPEIPKKTGTNWLPLGVVTDPGDGKLAHLDGLNISRAWMLEGIVSGLPKDDPRREALTEAAAKHRESGLASVTGEHYEGGHWLGSFAVYLVTERGLR